MKQKVCIICGKEKYKWLFCNWEDDFQDRCIECHYKISMKQVESLEKSMAISISEDERITIQKAYKKAFPHKNVKRKKSYPKEFSNKRRVLLWQARKDNWCTACWTKELLQVHHIDHDKFNNQDSNLLVLCFYCHAKEHKHMQGKKPAKFFK